ncbi:MAG: methionyl-tRNA formyltransferase, partial [Sciscionella sp.]
RKQVLVGTASHPLRLGEVQAAGKRKMAATDWARGTRIECGEALL